MFPLSKFFQVLHTYKYILYYDTFRFWVIASINLAILLQDIILLDWLFSIFILTFFLAQTCNSVRCLRARTRIKDYWIHKTYYDSKIVCVLVNFCKILCAPSLNKFLLKVPYEKTITTMFFADLLMNFYDLYLLFIVRGFCNKMEDNIIFLLSEEGMKSKDPLLIEFRGIQIKSTKKEKIYEGFPLKESAKINTSKRKFSKKSYLNLNESFDKNLNSFVVDLTIDFQV